LISSGQEKLAASYIVLLSTKQQVAQGLATLFQGLADGKGIQVQQEHLEIALQAMQNRDDWCLEMEFIGDPRLMVLEVAHYVAAPVPGHHKPLHIIKWACVYPEHCFHAIQIATYMIRELVSQSTPQYTDAMNIIKYLPDRISKLRPKALWERTLSIIARDTSPVQPLVDNGHQLQQIARAITKMMLTTQLLPADLNTQPDHVFNQHIQTAISQLYSSNADCLGVDDDEVQVMEELQFWWEYLVAQEDFNFVRAYHGRVEQARGLQSNVNSDVVYNRLVEGIDSTDVALRGESAVQHFVACIRQLPGQLIGPASTEALVQPILWNIYWLLVTLLPSLVPHRKKEYLEESLQLAVLITKDDTSTKHKRKIYEHMTQQQLQEFVMLMSISQTELLKYHDQVEPQTWQTYAQAQSLQSN